MGWGWKQKIQGIHLTAHINTWESRGAQRKEGFSETKWICWNQGRQPMQKPSPENDSEIQIDRQDFIVSAIPWGSFWIHPQGLVHLSDPSSNSNRIVTTLKRSSWRHFSFRKGKWVIRCNVQEWWLQPLH